MSESDTPSCKSCRYWKSPPRYEKHGTCELIPDLGEIGSKVYIQVGEMYDSEDSYQGTSSVWLRTSESFYCAEWATEES